ncbi:hypothetical protein LG329_11870 [Virgibacillus necropolis]|uniref:hypothetical protein n=1 Tax=Virgibacillus necropolis TaxID=163877 RepID=UPI00384F4DCA
MKKYWKFTAIVAVIVLGIGTFYVNSAMSAKQYPEFIIKKQSGNAEEIKSLVLEGNYHEGGPMVNANTKLKITSDGSEYRSNTSFLDQIKGHPAPMIKELQEEYRNFMRGKGIGVDSFFENKQFVAYAEVEYEIGRLASSDYKFAISVLDKDKGSTTSFSIKVPDSSEIQHMFVDDVQIVDNKLNLITQNMVREKGRHISGKHVYTVDLSTKRIISHEAIFSIPEQQGESFIDARLIKTNPKQAHKNLVFLKTENKVVQQAKRLEETTLELISYNLETKEKEEVDLPNSLKESQVSFFDGSTIYLTSYNEKNLVVTLYNIEKNKVGNEFTVELSNIKDNMEPPIIAVKDGKLYATTHVTNLKTKASVTVIDVETGETLYEGEVIRKDPPENTDQFELYLFEMLIK